MDAIYTYIIANTDCGMNLKWITPADVLKNRE